MVIGITGKKRAGKDTFAQFAKEYLEKGSYNVYILSFADKLKKSAARSLDYHGDDYIKFCDDLKEDGFVTVSFSKDENPYIWEISGRVYLQLFGTEAHREVFGEDFWVRNLHSEIFDILSTVDDAIVFITDVRYDNEADGCDQVVEIVRPNLDGNLDTHKSEQPIDRTLVDVSIVNHLDLDNLRTQAIMYMDRILEK